MLLSLLALAATASAALHTPSHSYLNQARQDPSEARPKKFAPGGYYRNQCLTHHNIHRANHSAPDLTWSPRLASTARKIAQSCRFEHNVEMDGGGYGQNIASGIPHTNISAVISDLWYNNEVEYFNGLYGNPDPTGDNFEAWGHFSQIVWKGTREVGCATVHCSGGVEMAEGTFDFTVCNYGGAGNVVGEFEENVGEPRGQKGVDWRYGQRQVS